MFYRLSYGRQNGDFTYIYKSSIGHIMKNCGLRITLASARGLISGRSGAYRDSKVMLFHRDDVGVCEPIPFNNLANANWDRLPKHGTSQDNGVNLSVFSTRVNPVRKFLQQVR